MHTEKSGVEGLGPSAILVILGFAASIGFVLLPTFHRRPTIDTISTNLAASRGAPGVAVPPLFAMAGLGLFSRRRERTRRRVEAERSAELAETIAALETFTESVSHDLRGPLAAILNFSAILREDYGDRLDAAGRDHLRRISSSASSAASMLDARVAFVRSGRTPLRKVRVDVARLAQEVCAEIAAARPDASLAVTHGDLPTAWADEDMLRFVFETLVGNACKFVRPGEKPLVEIGGRSAAGETIYSVRDHGIGFDMRRADQLFEVGRRLHAAEGYAGHGIALATAARMLRRHGGRIWAEGAVGSGAVFHFSVAGAASEASKTNDTAS